MEKHYTEEWKRLFETECKNWTPRNQQRYFNIPNDAEEVTEEELNACKELVAEINEEKAS